MAEPEESFSGEPIRVGAPQEPPASFTSVDLKEIDANLFVGEESALWRPPDARGVYGGQIVGQALSAALKTVPSEKRVHSLHSYFLMKGNAKRDIIYQVQNLRDGTSFSSRLVTASQQGQVIFVLLASFQVPHPASQPVVEHQKAMPMEIPPPESLPTAEQYYASLLDDPRCPEQWKPFIHKRTEPNELIDTRVAIVSDFFAQFGPPPPNRPKQPVISDIPRQALWIKTKKALPDDATVHAAVLAYASDMGLMATAKGNHSVIEMAVGKPFPPPTPS